ncbi:MAG: DUF4831 family protein [Mediterranea massiliensis]|nr:DUF4831 family protein [Mediterranea massiliensis]
MKKRHWIIAAALLLGTTSQAQTEVTAGVMRGKDYGVTYLLPKTEIELIVYTTKHTYEPGELHQYAEQYLRQRNPNTRPNTHWTIDRIETKLIGTPDKEKVYFVKLKDKTVAPLMELTEDGIVRSINLPITTSKSIAPTKEKMTNTGEIGAEAYLTEEILMSNSTAKMAELVAKEIYGIRESRNALLRGETENMPKDGEQLKIMLDNLTRQEQALSELFTGATQSESQIHTIRIEPKEMKDEVVFRFSKKMGILDKDDLAGVPTYISITDMKIPTVTPLEGSETTTKKKELDGIAYNVPGRAHIILTKDNKVIFEDERPVSQFGTTEYLANVLFNKNSTIQVLFDTTTGGLIKVERNEEK